MEKCKTFVWILFAVVVLGALGVAIYFIVDNAIDRKVKDCLTKHFDNQKLFLKFNITAPIDPASITYSAEDCKSIIEKGHEKTIRMIDELPLDNCTKGAIKVQPLLEPVFLYAVLKKEGHNATAILSGVLAKAGQACSNKTQVN